MMIIERMIRGSDKLTAIFGRWPSFHDAEVVDVHIWRGGKGRNDLFPVLTMKLCLWEPAGRIDSRGYFTSRNHTLATLRFHGLEDGLQLDDFNCQNVIFGLRIEPQERNEGASPCFEVALDPCYGISGSFRCREIEVVEATPYDPEEEAP